MLLPGEFRHRHPVCVLFAVRQSVIHYGHRCMYAHLLNYVRHHHVCTERRGKLPSVLQLYVVVFVGYMAFRLVYRQLYVREMGANNDIRRLFCSHSV